MPGNDFEKQVQQKMDELQFAPSDAVWQQVEARIAPRRRRRLFIWLPLLLLMLGAAGWWLQNQEPANGPTVPASGANTGLSQGQTPKSGSAPAPNKDQPTAITEKKENGTAVSVPGADKNAANDNVTASGEQPLQTNAGIVGEHPVRTMMVNRHAVKTGALSGTGKHAVGSVSVLTPKDVFKSQESEIVSKALEPILAAIKEDENDLHGVMPVFQSAIVLPVEIASPGNTNLGISSPATAENAKRKIQWGIEWEGGWTNTIDRFPAGIGSTPLYENKSAFSSSVGGGTSTVGGAINNSSTQPSSLQPLPGFSFGLVASKPIGKRLSLLTGLRYSYFAARLYTGSRIDTPGIQTFRAGTQFPFTNQHHFLEVPLGIEQILGKKQRWTGSASLVAGWLIAQKTVHVNTATGNYQDAAASQKNFQYGIELSARYQLMRRVPNWQIGPSVRYGISQLSSQSSDAGQHLFFGGISIRYWPAKK